MTGRVSDLFSLPIRAPFPGIRSFQPHEWPIFFGRNEHVADMLTVLENQRFLAVVGPSGSGKSSLVFAGLMPALKQGKLLTARSPDAPDWRFVVMRPGDTPYRNLANALLQGLAPPEASQRFHDDDPDVTEIVLRNGPLGFADVLRDAAIPKNANILLVVDQFEEIFRFRTREGASGGQAAEYRNAATAFIQLLLETARQDVYQVCVLLTMRTDFLGECDVFDGLPQAINQSQYLTPRLSLTQLSDAIQKPVQHPQFNGIVAPEVVQRIQNDIGTNRDELPIVQHAMFRAWQEATRRANGGKVTLSIADYESVGGLQRALSKHADEVVEDFKLPEDKRLVQKIFCALCERGPGGRLVRRPITIPQLARETDAPVDRVQSVVDAFRRDDRCFLMPSGDQKIDDDTKIDISHESLLRQWTTLKTWLDEDRRAAQEFMRLRDDANRWPVHEAFLREPALGAALKWKTEQQPLPGWAERYGGGLERTLEYIEKSEKERHRENLEADQKRQMELDKERRRADEQASNAEFFKKLTWALGAVTAVATICLIGIIGLVVLNKHLKSQAQSLSTRIQQLSEQEATYSEQTLNASNQLAAVTKSLKSANQLAELEDKTNQVNLLAIRKKGDLIRDNAFNTGARETFSRDEVLTAAAYYGAARELESKAQGLSKLNWSFLDVVPPPRVRYSGLISGVHDTVAMSFDRTGTNLILLSRDGTVRVQDVNSGHEVTRFPVGTNFSLPTFSSDGSRLAVIVQQTNALVWDVAHKTPVLLGSAAAGDRVTAVAYDFEDRHIALGMNSGAVTIYERLPQEKAPERFRVASAISSKPANDNDQNVSTHTVSSNEKLPAAPVKSMSFDAEKGLLILEDTAYWIGFAKPLMPRASDLNYFGDSPSALFSPDGSWFSCFDSYVWTGCSVSYGTSPDNSQGTSSSPGSGAQTDVPKFKTDYSFGANRWFVNEQLRSHVGDYWQVSMDSLPKSAGRRNNPLYSPDGQFEAMAYGPFINVHFFNPDSRLSIRACTANIQAIAVSPDGSLIASAGDDGIRFWEMMPPKTDFTSEADLLATTNLTFSPTGKLLAAGTINGTLYVWDVQSRTNLLETLAAPDSPSFISFSPEENAVLCGDNLNNARLWRLDKPGEVQFPHSLGKIVAFGPKSNLLASVSDTRAEIWNWQTKKLLASTNFDGQDASAVSFSPGGDALRLQSTTSEGVGWKFWNFKTGEMANATAGGAVDASSSETWASSDGIFSARLVTDEGQQKILIQNTLAGTSNNLPCDFNFDDQNSSDYGASDSGINSSVLSSFAFSSRNTFCFAAFVNGELRTWNLSKPSMPEAGTTNTQLSDIHAAAVSDDGNRIALVTPRDGVTIWIADTGQWEHIQIPSWMPTNLIDAKQLTGLTLDDLTLQPVSESLAQNGSTAGGAQKKPNPAVADCWRAWNQASEQLEEFKSLTNWPGPMANFHFLPTNWLAACPNYAMDTDDRQRIQKADEKLASDYCQAGFGLCQFGDYSNALSCFKIGTTLDNKSADASAGLGFVYGQLKPPNPSEVEKYIKQYSALDPDANAAEAFLTNGCALLDSDPANSGAAIPWFDYAIRLNPVLPQAYLWRGVLAWQTGNAVQARNYLLKSEQYDIPQSELIGDLMNESPDSTNAFRFSCLSVAIFLDPTNFQARFGRARWCEDNDRYDVAISDFTEAIRIEPDDDDLYNYRSVCYYRTGDYLKAVDDCNSAIAINATNNLYYSNRGAAYAEQENWSRSISDYSQAIVLSPNNTDDILDRAIACRNAKEWTNALGDINSVISIAGTNSSDYANDLTQRGRTYELMGRLDDAMADWREAENLSKEESTNYPVNYFFPLALEGKSDEAMTNYMQKTPTKTQSAQDIVYVARLYAIQAVTIHKNQIEAQNDIDRALKLLKGLPPGPWSRSGAYMDFAILQDQQHFTELTDMHYN